MKSNQHFLLNDYKGNVFNNFVNPHYSIIFHNYCGDDWPEFVHCIPQYWLVNQFHLDIAVYLNFYIIHPQERVLNLDLLAANDE